MATDLVARIPADARGRSVSLRLFRTLAAVGFLGGVFLAFLGFAWDVQWHTDVGPDTFFTAPHLVLYGGIAISGLTCLATVLLTTRYSRHTPAAMDGTIALLGGRFRGPTGYVIGGFGALFFLLYGVMDQWWHSLYGFDVTLVSPPHVGLILSIMVTMAGCLTALAWHVRTAADERQRVAAAGGTTVAAAVLVAFITPTLVDLLPWALFGRVSWPNIVLSLLYPAAILMVTAIVRRPWAGTLFGLSFTALDLLVTAIVPGMTASYAASIDLFLRDTTTGEVVVAGLVPTFVLAAGIASDLVRVLGQRFGWKVLLAAPLAGAAAALALRLPEADLPLYQPHAGDPAEFALMRTEVSSAVALASLILAPICGALGGWFGWLLGIVLAADVPSDRLRVGNALARPLAVLTLLVLLTLPDQAMAHASEPHHETLVAGPYTVAVGFSEWPIRAERSIDITFTPDGGIADKTATIEITDPAGEWYEIGPLGRHPRQRDVWGLDLIALPDPGDWTIKLTIDGPLGQGTGTLRGIPVTDRPGPPLWPMWLIAALPLIFLVWLGLRGWRAVRPLQTAQAHSWG
ncbi:MAG: hypothetical protein U0031_00845 [Thermomicrobiales bacterium]